MKMIFDSYNTETEEWLLRFRSVKCLYTLPIAGKPFIRYLLRYCWRMNAEAALFIDRFYNKRLAHQLNSVGVETRIEYRPGPPMNAQDIVVSYADFIGDDEALIFIGPRFPQSERFVDEPCPPSPTCAWKYVPGKGVTSVKGFGVWRFSSLQEWFDLNFRLLDGTSCHNLPGYRMANGIRFGAHVRLLGKTRIRGRVIFGDDVLLDRAVSLRGGVVVGDHCAIGAGTSVRHSVILPGSCLGLRLTVQGKIVDGDRVIDPADGTSVDVPHVVARPLRFWSNRFSGTHRLYADGEIVRTHPHFTLLRDPEAESQCDEALRRFTADFAMLPSAESIAAIYLGGGYGRGEGGTVWMEGRTFPYNDFDLFVVSRSARRSVRRKIDRDLAALAGKWEKLIRISIDFGAAETLGSMLRKRDTLMYQELLHGHITLLGEDVLTKACPRLDPAALPVAEALRLLLNRGAGLLLAALRLNRGMSGEADADFVRRNLHKAALGCGDARLLARGEYHWSLDERQALLGEDAAYQAAVAFKGSPGAVPGDILPAAWESRRADWIEALAEVLGGRTPVSAFGGSSLRSLLRSLWHTGNFDARPPLAVGLGLLRAQLTRPLPVLREDDPSVRAFLDHWRIFN